MLSRALSVRDSRLFVVSNPLRIDDLLRTTVNRDLANCPTQSQQLRLSLPWMPTAAGVRRVLR